MFLFKKHKNLSQKQTAIIGFVLAVMSLLITAVMVYIVPLVPAWLYSHGVFALDLFFMGFVLVAFLAIQALILFGFPLFYAQDKKSHMTGFQILLYALGWQVLLVAVVVIFSVVMAEPISNDYDVWDDIDWEEFEADMEAANVEVVE